ncbi:MAG: hypothetical protein OEY64_03305 [Nitrospinota bacterium]|nr:hypothetical protein [Nitrospinota bacterium]
MNCKERYCDEKNPCPVKKWTIKDPRGEVILESRVCPLGLIPPEANLLFELYEHYRQGRLMFPSRGLLEQPNYYLQIMRLLDKLWRNRK